MSANTDKPAAQDWLTSFVQNGDTIDEWHSNDDGSITIGTKQGNCYRVTIEGDTLPTLPPSVTDKPQNQHRCDKCQHQCAACSQFIEPFFDRVHGIQVWGHTDTAPNEASPDHVAVPTCDVIRTTPMRVTKTVQFKLDFTFSQREQFLAGMAGNERGVSQHKVLTEQLRGKAVRILINNGFAVAQS